MEEQLLELKRLSNMIHPIPENEWNEFESVWNFFSVVRKELLTRVGEVEKYLYFIVDGIQRIYSTNNGGKKLQ